VINRCLEKEPARRFAGVSEFARELARFGSEDGRASSERVSRISLAPAFPKPADRGAVLQLVSDPTLIAIEPPARRRPRPSPGRWAVPLLLVACGMFGVLWLTLHGRGGVPAPAASAAAQSAASPTHVELGPAAPIVTPVPGAVWTEPAPAPAPVPISTQLDSVAVAPALSAVLRRPNVRILSRVERAAMPLPTNLPPPSPVVRAPDPAPATNPLDDRK
jgi:serine/threonine-protein kinase